MKKMVVMMGIVFLLCFLPLGVMAEDNLDVPEHSLYIGNTAVSIGYLINSPEDATQLVNQLVTSQGLSMADLWYRINDGPVLNILTGEAATEEELIGIKNRLDTYIDENGEEHQLLPDHYAVGVIQVGAMSFNDVYVNEVVEVPGATHFAIEGIAALREIDGGNPVTFMGTGSKELQVTNEGGTVLATGTLLIPQAFGEHDFTVGLTLNEGTGILRGTAVFKNQEIHEGIIVTARSESVDMVTTTAADGSFAFYNLPTGDLVVEASYYNYYPTSKVISVVSGEEIILEDSLILYPMEAYGTLDGYAKYIDKDTHQGIAIHVRTLEGEELPDLRALTDRNDI